ncbi:MAG: hypothetical protein FJ100_05665 [Deltaproteobacteria bacterium]|nr:hypothetical protein [Deltaproteobacteria bacterium]
MNYRLAIALGALCACTPPEPPPPRPAAARAAPTELRTEPEADPQAAQAVRTDGLQGGTLVFEDHFDRADLGPDWLGKHAGEWILEGGEVKANRVQAEEVRNQGLWLQKPLPDKVRVTFRARSLSRVGDTKCEIFATEPRHEAGYSVIFGGWNNTINTITRLGEHEPRRVVQSDHQRVESGRTYAWTLVRTDHVVRWYIDGKFMIAYPDDRPVRGSFFGFNNWATDVRYDDLQVFAL